MVSSLEPDTLQCEVKRALGSITTIKASGSDWIPAAVFNNLEDDGVIVVHSICQLIWRTGAVATGLEKVNFIPIPKKGNAKEWSNYQMIVLILHDSQVMLKILQTRLQQYVNWVLPGVHAGFRKGRGTRNQLANICWIMEKAREFQKNISFFIDSTKGFGYVDHNKLW